MELNNRLLDVLRGLLLRMIMLLVLFSRWPVINVTHDNVLSGTRYCRNVPECCLYEDERQNLCEKCPELKMLQREKLSPDTCIRRVHELRGKGLSFSPRDRNEQMYIHDSRRSFNGIYHRTFYYDLLRNIKYDLNNTYPQQNIIEHLDVADMVLQSLVGIRECTHQIIFASKLAPLVILMLAIYMMQKYSKHDLDNKKSGKNSYPRKFQCVVSETTSNNWTGNNCSHDGTYSKENELLGDESEIIHLKNERSENDSVSEEIGNCTLQNSVKELETNGLSNDLNCRRFENMPADSEIENNNIANDTCTRKSWICSFVIKTQNKEQEKNGQENDYTQDGIDLGNLDGSISEDKCDHLVVSKCESNNRGEINKCESASDTSEKDHDNSEVQNQPENPELRKDMLIYKSPSEAPEANALHFDCDNNGCCKTELVSVFEDECEARIGKKENHETLNGKEEVENYLIENKKYYVKKDYKNIYLHNQRDFYRLKTVIPSDVANIKCYNRKAECDELKRTYKIEDRKKKFVASEAVKSRNEFWGENIQVLKNDLCRSFRQEKELKNGESKQACVERGVILQQKSKAEKNLNNTIEDMKRKNATYGLLVRLFVRHNGCFDMRPNITEDLVNETFNKNHENQSSSYKSTADNPEVNENKKESVCIALPKLETNGSMSHTIPPDYFHKICYRKRIHSEEMSFPSRDNVRNFQTKTFDETFASKKLYNCTNDWRKEDYTSITRPSIIPNNTRKVVCQEILNKLHQNCINGQTKIKSPLMDLRNGVYDDENSFFSLKDKCFLREESLPAPLKDPLKLPRLAKHVVNADGNKNKTEQNYVHCEKIPKLKCKTLPVKRGIEDKDISKFSRRRSLEKQVAGGLLNLPYSVLGYRRFSREWQMLLPQRRYHVYTLLSIPERIETFRFWPSDSPVSKIDLVEAGFIYKGDGYEVQCDSCKLVKSDWKRGDVPLNIHKFLKPDCEFLKTTFPDLKIPAGRNEIDCSFSFESQHTLVNQMDAMNIANPIAQNNNSMETNTIKNGEETNSSDARVPNSIISAPQQQPLFDGSYTTLNPSTLFPTGANAIPADDGFLIAGLRPRHPDYATIQQRIWSFRPWVYGHIQDPPYLVDAGFYFIGREDIVRCYFCDIGLAEWDKEDDPWVEHARHSPDCEYLKREKGPEFIESIQSSWRQIYCPRHPEFADYHIRVESFANWPSDLDQRPNALAEAGFYYTGEEDVVRCHYCDGGLRQWESGDVPWTEHARWFPFCKYIVKIKGLAFVEEIARRYNLLTQSPAIDPETQEMVDEALSEGERYNNLPNEVYDRILELGYTCRQINRAFHRHVQMTGRRHASADELTNILLENEFSVAPSINNKPSSAAKEIAEMKTPSDIETLEPEKLIDMNKQLKQQLICNTCEKNESNIVFSPCGHRIACEACSKDLSACNACGVNIQAKIKTYLA